MKKVEKQRIEYLNSLTFDDNWNKTSLEVTYGYNLRNVFSLYHDVMYSFCKLPTSQFVRTWWCRVFDKSFRLIPLTENKINQQKSTFDIDFDSAANKIVDIVKCRMESFLGQLNKY